MISKYNLIRFILDEAAEKNPNIEWNEWFRKVSRIFAHKIPEALLLGLSKQSDTLKMLCDEYRSNSKPKPQSTVDDRYKNWIKRRDEGNKRAFQKRLEQKEDADTPKEILSTFVMTDDEIKQKMPDWQEQFKVIREKRQQEQEDLWRFDPNV
jgi:gas vesicle protein